MKNYDIYLFDFDGTTFDTKESLVPVFKSAFAAIGMDCTPEQAHHYMHQNALQTFLLRYMTPLKRPFEKPSIFQKPFKQVAHFPKQKKYCLLFSNKENA